MGDEGDLNRRKAMFGTNDKPRPQLPPFGESLVDALNDRILVVTAGFAVLSVITGMIQDWREGWREGVCILIALLVQVLITACNDYAKDTRFVQLQSHAHDEELPVVRGKAGAMQTINVWELVVGDVVVLTRGDRAPADCVVIEAINCQVEDHDSDGGVEAVGKERGDRLDAGTFLTTGEAKVLVCAVGAHSTRGVEDELHNTRDQETLLTKKLDSIGGSLRFIGLLFAIGILVLAMIILVCTVGKIDGATFCKKLVDNMTLALIILIVAIPEGLPMTVGSTLAYSVDYMFAKDHLLVRDLTAIETLGVVDELCIGKTGTMTTEKMEVVNFYLQDTLQKNTRKNSLFNCNVGDHILDQLIESIVFNTSAYIEMTENSFYVPVGNGTETSLINWLQAADVPVHEKIRQKTGRVLFSRPFDSRLQRSVVAVEHPVIQDCVRVYVKGAPEVVLGKCNKCFDPSGNVIAFDQAKSGYVSSDILVENMCKNSLRVIAFAVNDLDPQQFEDIKNETANFSSEDTLDKLELGSTFLSLVALRDPPRDDVKRTLDYAERAGLNLRLLSGDHLETCRAFACDAGIISKEQYDQVLPEEIKRYAIEARDLWEQVGGLQLVNDEAGPRHAVKNLERFADLVPDLKVVARCSPQEKLLMIVGLQSLDGNKAAGEGLQYGVNKVAVVGEGINDIEAFRQADISFAMGSGCSKNRNEASIVVTDDNVESIMRAFMWGRNIWLNVQRFLTFQMTCNFACLLTIVVGYCYLTESPLNAVMLIWINLVMDIFGAIALASIRPNTADSTIAIEGDRVLHPYNYRAIYGNALWMIVMMTIVIFGKTAMWDLHYQNAIQTTESNFETYDANCEPIEYCQKYPAEGQVADKKLHLTLIFNAFVFLQIMNAMNAKVIDPKKLNPFANLLLENWVFVLILLLLVFMQVIFCFTWFGEVVIEAENDGLEENPTNFTVCIAFGATVLAAGALFKYFPERFAKKLPSLDEDKALGSDNALMKAYDQQANAKMIQKKGKAVSEFEDQQNGEQLDHLFQDMKEQ